jgi:hypothetical protein
MRLHGASDTDSAKKERVSIERNPLFAGRR